MNLKQFYLTNNACYKIGRKLNVQGLMLHSTGADNPNISRYVPLEVVKPNNWNTNTPRWTRSMRSWLYWKVRRWKYRNCANSSMGYARLAL